jgi:hypothetical protein
MSHVFLLIPMTGCEVPAGIALEMAKSVSPSAWFGGRLAISPQ